MKLIINKETIILIAGQFGQIAKEFYKKECKISVLESSTKMAGARNVLVKFRLDYDNSEWVNI